MKDYFFLPKNVERKCHHSAWSHLTFIISIVVTVIETSEKRFLLSESVSCFSGDARLTWDIRQCLPPPQAFPTLSESMEQARSKRTRDQGGFHRPTFIRPAIDQWEAREGDDGNERRARAGSDPSHHSFHPRRSRATGNEVDISANFLLINVHPFLYSWHQLRYHLVLTDILMLSL